MTTKLSKLIEEWIEETDSFKRASNRYIAAATSLTRINEAIYNQAKEEGLTIDAACKLYEDLNKK